MNEEEQMYAAFGAMNRSEMHKHTAQEKLRQPCMSCGTSAERCEYQRVDYSKGCCEHCDHPYALPL